MNYELCKSLKDAGFPQNYVNISDPNCKDTRHAKLAFLGICCGVYEPYLSDLIRACGDGIRSIYRMDKVWFAVSVDEDDKINDLGKDCYGSTPEEAVAKLWLALNKK